MGRESVIDIHNYQRKFQNAERAVQRSSLSTRNKVLIAGYGAACQRQEVCGRVRLIRVFGALTLFGRLLEQNFDTVTRAHIEQLVTRLLRADPPYSPETLGTYKAILKKFITWVAN